MRCRGLGPTIFESLWWLGGALKEIVSLYTRWHPVIPTRSERGDAAPASEPQRLRFLFTVSRSQWQVEGGSRYLSRVPSARFLPQHLKKIESAFRQAHWDCRTDSSWWWRMQTPTFRWHMGNKEALLVRGSFVGTWGGGGWRCRPHTNPINFPLGLQRLGIN